MLLIFGNVGLRNREGVLSSTPYFAYPFDLASVVCETKTCVLDSHSENSLSVEL